jgi:hypothetical protein
MLVMIVLAPVATAVDIVAVATATIATSAAVNITSSLITTNNNTNTTPTDYNTATNANATSNNTRTVRTDIASTIASWTSLSSSIAAAAGKTVTLTLSTPFDMTGFQSGSAIEMKTAQTAITILGNAAVFDATCTTTAPTGTESTSLIPLLLYSYHYCRGENRPLLLRGPGRGVGNVERHSAERGASFKSLYY